jgi:acyl carrier protein
MKEAEIKKVIFKSLKIIAPETNPETELGPDDDIKEKLYIDSFDALQFIVAICDQLNIDIPEEDYGKTSTLRTLIPYLKEKTG